MTFFRRDITLCKCCFDIELSYGPRVPVRVLFFELSSRSSSEIRSVSARDVKILITSQRSAACVNFQEPEISILIFPAHFIQFRVTEITKNSFRIFPNSIS